MQNTPITPANMDAIEDRVDVKADPAPFPEWIDQIARCLDAID